MGTTWVKHTGTFTPENGVHTTTLTPSPIGQAAQPTTTLRQLALGNTAIPAYGKAD